MKIYVFIIFKPFITNLDLYFEGLSIKSFVTLYTHLIGIGLFSRGNWVNVHVRFCEMEFISSLISIYHHELGHINNLRNVPSMSRNV